MRIPGLGRAKNTLRRASSGMRSEAIILLYHRVADTQFDPQALSVSPTNFQKHLELLHSSYAVLSLRELLERLKHGSLPKRSVVITFDDGYADNLSNVKPLLEQRNLPATVFITTGNIGKGIGFWWDNLARLLLEPGNLPPTIELEISGEKHKWDLSKTSTYSPEASQKDSLWNVATDHTPTPRHNFYRALGEMMRPLPADEIENVINNLMLQTGKLLPESCSLDRAMTSQEIKNLATGELIEIGAHTQTHTKLASLSPENQLEEISGSKKILEEILGSEVKNFSYPFGGHIHYTNETVKLVEEAGFSSSCSNFPGTIGKNTDLFQLPRHLVRDWDSGTLGNKLKDWFRG